MGRTFVKKQLPVGSADRCKSQLVHQINFKLFKTEKVSKYPAIRKEINFGRTFYAEKIKDALINYKQFIL